MDTQLKGKRALVTGSTGDIGAGIALSLAREGVSVALNGRNEEAAKRIAAHITEQGGHVVMALGDLGSDEGAQKVADAAIAALGGVDILVNNAGTFQLRDFMNISANEWAKTYNSDVLSMVRMTQMLAPAMKESGWGRIVNIASGAAISPQFGPPDYSAAKAAVVNLSISIAQSFAATGITCNTVSPGPIDNKAFRQEGFGIAAQMGFESDNWDEVEKHLLQTALRNPSNRLGTVEDVAAAVTFLCSPLTSWINGANLRVDGGLIGVVN